MPGETAHRSEIDLTSALSELPRIRAFVREACTALPPGTVSADDLAELDIAVTEAASNIMRHGYKGRSDQALHVMVEAADGRIAVCLGHFGEPLNDAAILTAPIISGGELGGMGLALIRELTDDVRFHRDAKHRHCMTLIKKLSPMKEEEDRANDA